VDKRSVRRHLAELEGVGLITRHERPGKPSLLIIEDPSGSETESYLRNFAGSGEDKIVRPYKKEEPEERQNLVNEEQALSEVGKTNRHLSRGRNDGSVPKAKREYLAGEMLAVLRDERSLGYYRRVAETVQPHRIFEALGTVRQASRDGRIKKSRGALFTAIINGLSQRQLEKCLLAQLSG
jgi:hypothetical protein